MTVCTPADPSVDVELSWTDPDSMETVTLLIPWDSTDDPDTPWWWTALTWPFFDYRYTNAPTSEWLPGDVLLAAVPGASSVPIAVVVHTDPADGQAGLLAARTTLESAFRAVDLTLAFLINDEVVDSWAAQPARMNWGAVSIDTLGMMAQEGSVVVPVNPVEAT